MNGEHSELYEAIQSVLGHHSLREAAAQLNLHHTALLDGRLKARFTTGKLERLARCKHSTVRALAIKALLAQGNAFPRPLRQPAEGGFGITSYRYVVPGQLPNPDRCRSGSQKETEFYLHAATQLACADLPPSELPSTILEWNNKWEEVSLYPGHSELGRVVDDRLRCSLVPQHFLEQALIYDLVATFIDAVYFAAFARNVKFRATPSGCVRIVNIPLHPLNRILLNGYYYPEQRAREDNDNRVTPGMLNVNKMERESQTRTPWHVFEESDRLAGTGALKVRKVADQAQAYEYLSEVSTLEQTAAAVVEPEIIQAGAAVAAFRSTVAAAAAASTFLNFGKKSISASSAFIALRIRELCEFTRSDRWEFAIDSVERLSHLEGFTQGCNISKRALVEGTGIWFGTYAGHAYLSKFGSILHSDHAPTEIYRFESMSPKNGEGLPPEYEWTELDRQIF